MHKVNESYGGEGERLHHKGEQTKMPSSNGNGKVYDVFLKMMQPAIVIALALLGWGISDIKGSINANAEILRKVELTQVRVTETVKRIEIDIADHEAQTMSDVFKRSRYHHTEIRSCLQCKVRGEEHPSVPLVPPKGK